MLPPHAKLAVMYCTYKSAYANDVRTSNYTYVIHDSSPLFLSLLLVRDDLESRRRLFLWRALLGDLTPTTTGFFASDRYRFNNALVGELLATKVFFREVTTVHQLRVTIHAVCDDGHLEGKV